MRKYTTLSTSIATLAVVAGVIGTSPAAHATTFGGNGRLVFIAKSKSAGDTDVWIANADGSGRKDLTRRSRANETQATWSPEAGAHIAFIRGADVWRINNDGSNLLNIT